MVVDEVDGFAKLCGVRALSQAVIVEISRTGKSDIESPMGQFGKIDRTTDKGTQFRAHFNSAVAGLLVQARQLARFDIGTHFGIYAMHFFNYGVNSLACHSRIGVE